MQRCVCVCVCVEGHKVGVGGGGVGVGGECLRDIICGMHFEIMLWPYIPPIDSHTLL